MTSRPRSLALLRLLPLLAAAVALAGSRPARACDCIRIGPTFHPPYVPEAFAAAVTTSEEVAGLTCRPARRGKLACTWTARYALTRAVATDIPLTFAYPTGADIVIRLDGEVAASSIAALDPRFGIDQRELFVTWPAGQASRTVVEIRAELVLGTAICGCDRARTTNRRRHPLVSPASLPDYAVVYQPQEQPESMRLSLDFRRPWREYKPGLFRGGKGRRITRDLRKDDDDPATFAFKTPLRLDPGGPIAGVGLGFSPEGLRPRLRLGWELAWPQVLVHSLVIETDARARVAVIPAWELTYPRIPHPIIPDSGIGVGVPVQLAPLARPGVRVFARLGWFWCHVLGTFDIYPAFRGAPPERLGSLMLQFGL
ncbi:hypothetical protein [Nannocystis punicea]|uniref:Uncharacterized protein n=1 Tax=Nannocystis punicea TaxID=2995304 RepID=A0ABY7HC38_9BACT|nr:hypothetical protein [Nannocystis poenicansa]WAS96848.1 hypothetical protein O0S08_11930 [Nannocystis poenicansa]